MNNMPNKKSVIALAVGSAFVATLGTASVASAADNPFSAQSLDKGYKIAMSHEDDKGGVRREEIWRRAMWNVDGGYQQ